jgi:ribosomal protein S18 acetylase RimI-like enzyme
MHEIEIRRLVESDVEAFRTLRLFGLEHSPSAFGSSFEEESLRPLSAFLERLTPDGAGSFVLGAWRAGVLVGQLGMLAENRLKTRHRGFVWGIYVRPECRTQGIAKAMLERCIAEARAISTLRQLHLTVVMENEGARRLYRSVGFTSYGVEPASLQVDGRLLDEDMLVLVLPGRA